MPDVMDIDQMCTNWNDKIPPQDFLADGADIRQGIMVIKCRQSVVAYHKIEFSLGPRFNICVYRHIKEERVCR
jgi:hypothetical protein